MKFLVDAQLPKTLSFLLVSLGCDSVHTLDLPLRNRTTDDTIIQLAIDESRIVVTKDNDFLQSFLLKNLPPKLLMVNTGNIANQTLLDLFRKNLVLILSLFQTRSLVEVTRSEVVVHD